MLGRRWLVCETHGIQNLEIFQTGVGILNIMQKEKSKYASQAAYNRRTYVRFPLDLRPEILEAFRKACRKNETSPTTEIKRFIQKYIDENV